MEMAVCNAKVSLEKKRKRKQKKRGNTTRADYIGCDPAEENASTDNNVSQESKNKICSSMEPEKGQSHLEVNLLGENILKKHDALQCGEASGICVSLSTILNVKVLKEEDETSTSPNVDFCLADGKENSLVPEEPDREGTNKVKRDYEHTETVDHLTPSGHVETQRMRKRRRRREKGRSLEHPKSSLESNLEDEKKVSLSSHPREETSSHLKMVAKEEVMNEVLWEESIDCSVSEKTELLSANTKESSMVNADPHETKDFENTTMIEKDDDCLEAMGCLAQSNSDEIHGKTKRKKKKNRRKRKFENTTMIEKDDDCLEAMGCLAQSNSDEIHGKTKRKNRRKRKFADTFEGSLNSDVEDNKREETIKQKVPHLLACDATNDNIGSVLEKNSLSQISNSSNERNATGFSKKKLLILDVNGLLVDFVPYFPDGYTPDIVISRKAVFKRPFCDNFLQFCFERFEVGIWSSRTWKNLRMLVELLMRDSRHKLLFCWNQSHCTTTRFNTIENDRKPLVLKELNKIWENLEPNLPWKKGEYDASNTLLLDDSPYKALRNPANTAVFPTTYRYKDSDDTSLGPGGDLRTYLEGVSTSENVQKYVEQNPFGQKPISESSSSWKFYRRIVGL